MRIVGIGGTLRPNSSSEAVLHIALEGARKAGGTVRCVAGRELDLPIYDPNTTDRTPAAVALVDAVRGADGVIFASPGYHGTVSGLVKNAIDYMEDLASAEPCYLDGRAVGCIGVAYGWQAAVNTVNTLRDIAHALRGWPTPVGASINAATTKAFVDGRCADEDVRARLELVGQQTVELALARRAATTTPSSATA